MVREGVQPREDDGSLCGARGLVQRQGLGGVDADALGCLAVDCGPSQTWRREHP
jgi:hypothetical protein